MASRLDSVHALVLVATPWEALPLYDEIMMGLEPDPTFDNHPYPTKVQNLPHGRITLVETWIGPHNAAAAAAWAIATHKPTYVLVVGSAGSPTPCLLPGDIILGAECTQIFPPSVMINRDRLGLPPAGCRYLACGKSINLGALEADNFLLTEAIKAADKVVPKLAKWTDVSRPPMYITGRIGSMDDWTTDTADYERLVRLQIDAEDMESAFAAMACASHGIPFLAIRGISNNGRMGFQPKSLDEVKATSALASHRVGEVVSELLVQLIPDVVRS